MNPVLAIYLKYIGICAGFLILVTVLAGASPELEFSDYSMVLGFMYGAMFRPLSDELDEARAAQRAKEAKP